MKMQIRSEQPLILLRESASGMKTVAAASTDDGDLRERFNLVCGLAESYRRSLAASGFFDDAKHAREAAQLAKIDGFVFDDASPPERLREAVPRGVTVKFDFDDDTPHPSVFGPAQELHK